MKSNKKKAKAVRKQLRAMFPGVKNVEHKFRDMYKEGKKNYDKVQE